MDLNAKTQLGNDRVNEPQEKRYKGSLIILNLKRKVLKAH